MPRILQVLVALLGLALLAPDSHGAPLSPDVVSPGTKRIRHEYVLEGLDQFPDHEFLLAPKHLDGWQPVVQGQPFQWYHLMDARFYACPKGDAPNPEDGDEWLKALPKTGWHAIRSSVPALSKIERRRTTLRVIAVTDSEVQVELVADQNFNSRDEEISGTFGEWVRTPLLLSVAAIALFLLVRGPKLRSQKS